ncbi:hypothetical protein MNBD_ALPHA04-652 [hydrothermal vent metagenome]|uniref:Uncharacterized protein n=1 Tax=hydrothermal vent metagenome TaxID=652676 RepID=A0A3B0SE13_9ZZZZ
MASAKALFAVLFLPIMSAAPPATASTPYADKPMETHIGNAMLQPLRDVNLKKDKIPERLLQIEDDPYNLDYIDGCRALVSEIVSLYPLLGPDVNEVQLQSDAEVREQSASRIAGGIIGGLIPFRGIVRELTGANAHERDYRAALSAGFARRSFLKGIATAEGCIPPPPAFRMTLVYDYRGF